MESIPPGSLGQYLYNNFSYTDANGTAQCTMYLGDQFGNYTVRSDALLSGSTDSVIFNASAVPFSLQYESGDMQNAVVDSDLPAPLSVRVVNSTGSPLQDYWVNWTITSSPPGSAGQFLSANRSLTNVSGIAETGLHLSNRSGVYKIMAKAERYGVEGTFEFTAIAIPNSPAKITLTPQTKSLEVDQSVQFLAAAFDKFNNSVTIAQYNWSCTGGTIDTSGNFTAGTVAMSGTVTADLGTTVNATSLVNITAGPPQRIEIIPKAAIMTADQTSVFNATVYDRYANVWNLPIQWNVDNLSGGAVMPDGTLYPSRAGNWTVYANLTAPKLSGNASFEVIPGRISALGIFPPNVTLRVRESENFSAAGYDWKGNYIPNATAVWSSDAGIITETGAKSCTFNAGKLAMNGFLNATSGTVNASANVSVLPGSATSIVISPGTYELKSNDRITFTGYGRDAYNNTISNLPLKWGINHGLGIPIAFQGTPRCVVQARNVDGIADSDRDMLPDSSDLLVYDYNNDGKPDNSGTRDTDADGITDYPAGIDQWLNVSGSDKPSIYINSTGAWYTGALMVSSGTVQAGIFLKLKIRTSGFTGSVLDEKGNPISNCSVKAVAAGRVPLTTISNETGRYSIFGATEGSYTLEYNASGFKNRSVKAELKKTDWEFIWLEDVKLDRIVVIVEPSNLFIYAVALSVILIVVIVVIIFIFAILPRLKRRRNKDEESKQFEEELELQRSMDEEKKRLQREKEQLDLERKKLIEDEATRRSAAEEDVKRKLSEEDKRKLAEEEARKKQEERKKKEEDSAKTRRQQMDDEWKKLEDELLTRKPQTLPDKGVKKDTLKGKDVWLEDTAKKYVDKDRKQKNEDEQKKRLQELKSKLDEL
jgi:flagellar biosynthesis GTPase FlhF